ncbi:unnamed protein product [Prunus brigantina]
MGANCKIGRQSLRLTLESLIRSIRDSDSQSTSSYTILEVQRTTYLKLRLIERSEPIEPKYRILGTTSIRLSNDNQFQIQAYCRAQDSKENILQYNGPPRRGPCATTCRRHEWLS